MTDKTLEQLKAEAEVAAAAYAAAEARKKHSLAALILCARASRCLLSKKQLGAEP